MSAFTPLLFLVIALGDWNPQRADLVFTSSRDGDNEIYSIGKGETKWTNLTNTPGSDNWSEWSPD